MDADQAEKAADEAENKEATGDENKGEEEEKEEGVHDALTTTEPVATTGDGENGAEEDDLNSKRDVTLEKIVEEDENRDAHALRMQAAAAAAEAAKYAAENSSKQSKTESSSADLTSRTSVQMGSAQESLLPVRGIETHEFLDRVKKSSDQIRAVQATLANLTGNEGALVEINKKPPTSTTENADVDQEKDLDECCHEAASVVEKIFKYQAVEFDGSEENEEGEEGGEEGEEEEGVGEEEAEEGEEEEGEEEDEENFFDPSVRDKKLLLGETCHYCPVTLHTKQILAPGSVDFQSKYREKTYRFVSDEARGLFLENPQNFLPNPRKRVDLPPPRILVLGPRGSGKSVQSRQLADKFNLFHVKFRDYLQEMIIGKVKKRCEPEREEDKELIEDDDDEEAEEEEMLK
jgi:YHS domain-containing protein